MIPDDDLPVAATIEELDGPAPQEHARALRWERVIGLLLVLGLAGFALSGWWDQQTRAGHYRAGSRAAAVLDWDTARAEFAAAAGYSDAATRLADAQTKIATRDRQYALGTAAAGRADWVGVLQALQPLQLIAPHYRDADALASRALTAAATEALTGVVALRLQADPPGLYRFGAGGWRALPDGDSLSRVRAICPDGGVLYDVPAPPGAGTSILRPSNSDMLALWSVTPRQLRRALPGGDSPARLLVDPDPTAGYICTASAVWTLRSTEVGIPTGSLDALDALSVRYQHFDGTPPVTPTVPGPNWYIVGTAPEADLLLFDNVVIHPTGPAHTRLFAANLDGSALRLLLDWPGVLQSAEVSADGRYALVTLAVADESTRAATFTTFILNTGGRLPPQVLLNVADTAATGVILSSRQMVLLRQPPRTDQILLTWTEGARQVIRVIDPAQPAHPLLDTQVDVPWLNLNPPVLDPRTGNLLLIGNGRAAAAGAEPSGVAITPQNRVQLLPFAIPAYGALWVRRDQLLAFTAESYDVGPWHLTLQSRPTSTADPGAAFQEIYSTTQRYANDPSIPFRLAPNWLVYSGKDGALYGHSYDGTLDVRLPWSVTGFSVEDLREQP